MKIALLLALLVVAGLAFVRFAPSDPDRWHVDPLTASDPAPGGVLRRQPVPLEAAEALARFDAVARAAPRTQVLAGSLAEAHLTYVVRSRWIGFPDYVSVKAVAGADGTELAILSRLRFGYSDMGVNAARLDRWLQALQSVQE